MPQTNYRIRQASVHVFHDLKDEVMATNSIHSKQTKKLLAQLRQTIQLLKKLADKTPQLIQLFVQQRRQIEKETTRSE